MRGLSTVAFPLCYERQTNQGKHVDFNRAV